MITIFLLREKGFNLKKLKKQKNLFEELKKRVEKEESTSKAHYCYFTAF